MNEMSGNLDGRKTTSSLYETELALMSQDMFSRKQIDPSGVCLIGVGGWVVGPRSSMYTRHVYILLCCFKCPLATEVLSVISF